MSYPWLRSEDRLIRINDLVLVLVIFCSIAAGIGLPEYTTVFSPYPFVLLMVVLFFSFLKIEFVNAFHEMRKAVSILFVLCLLKLLVLPVALFFLTRAVLPEYALPVLLLSGISTGVVAPFISSLLNASTLLVLMMVVISSLLAPFSLPALVKLLVGQTLDLSFLAMVKTLAMLVLLPALAATLLRYAAPSFPKKVERIQYPLSVVIFACINLGVFSKYSSYFRQRLEKVAEVVLIAFALSLVYHIVGLLVTWGRRGEDRLAGAVSLAYMNNVLIVVFSSQFFGPLSPTLAAVYMLPFFVMIVPARMVGDRFRAVGRGKSGGEG
jgi:BASS family bile acid:Na+ symporter